MGIQIFPDLANKHSELATLSGVNTRLPEFEENPVLYIQEVIAQWSRGNSHHPPSWGQLLQVLWDIGLTELGEEIEKFLKGKDVRTKDGCCRIRCTTKLFM